MAAGGWAQRGIRFTGPPLVPSLTVIVLPGAAQLLDCQPRCRNVSIVEAALSAARGLRSWARPAGQIERIDAERVPAAGKQAGQQRWDLGPLAGPTRHLPARHALASDSGSSSSSCYRAPSATRRGQTRLSRVIVPTASWRATGRRPVPAARKAQDRVFWLHAGAEKAWDAIGGSLRSQSKIRA